NYLGHIRHRGRAYEDLLILKQTAIVKCLIGLMV
ncbi:MAG: hypothetical protein ACI96W_003973, partial [Paraglaciecola sp.]